MTDGVLGDLDSFEGHAVPVARDFEVGRSDTRKNGVDLEHDFYAVAVRADLSDEAHALLSQGPVGGLKMKNITLGIPDSACPDYPRWPIDDMYIAGRETVEVEKEFKPAKKSANTVSSDHTPVWTVYMTP